MAREPWEIQWFRCTADSDDVKFAKSEGRTIKVGDELWRVPHAIGPIGTDHSHWVGEHLTGEPEDWQLVSAAPVMQDALVRADKLIQWMSKYIGQMAPRDYSECYTDLNEFGLAIQHLRNAKVINYTSLEVGS